MTQPDPLTMNPDDLRAAVRSRYAAAAVVSAPGGCCQAEAGPAASGAGLVAGADPITRDNYDDAAAQVSAAALSASLGCGNPTALVDLAPGQTVLDLGSGAGLDVLLSARRVAPGGKAYGVDMTPEMLDLARRNQAEAGVVNAEFLLGTIEQVPLADASVDVVISNCVINLAADKDSVLREAFRVLAPGGRFAVADVVLLREVSGIATGAMQLWTGCLAGALLDEDYLDKLASAGFAGASVEVTRTYTRADLEDLAAQLGPDDLPAGTDVARVVDALDGAVASAFVRADKPA